MKGVYRKTTTGFAPVNDVAMEFHSKTKPDTNIIMTGKRPRNEKHHRKFFKLCQIIVENTDRYRTSDEVCTMFKIATGHVEAKLKKPDRQSRLWASEIEKMADKKDSTQHAMLQDIAAFLREGQTVYVPKSISFESMAQDKFEEFYDSCIRLTCKYIIPALDEGILKKEIEEFVQ